MPDGFTLKSADAEFRLFISRLQVEGEVLGGRFLTNPKPKMRLLCIYLKPCHATLDGIPYDITEGQGRALIYLQEHHGEWVAPKDLQEFSDHHERASRFIKSLRKKAGPIADLIELKKGSGIRLCLVESLRS